MECRITKMEADTHPEKYDDVAAPEGTPRGGSRTFFIGIIQKETAVPGEAPTRRPSDPIGSGTYQE